MWQLAAEATWGLQVAWDSRGRFVGESSSDWPPQSCQNGPNNIFNFEKSKAGKVVQQGSNAFLIEAFKNLDQVNWSDLISLAECVLYSPLRFIPIFHCLPYPPPPLAPPPTLLLLLLLPLLFLLFLLLLIAWLAWRYQQCSSCAFFWLQYSEMFMIFVKIEVLAVYGQ